MGNLAFAGMVISAAQFILLIILIVGEHIYERKG